ncbi:plasmid transfer protein [Erwinia amylovora]|uniref:plasmid transfer protein n=1 Tax=Erwinia amylovora TaxID=552 RepID=UPI001F04AECA|nr:plasmid transfer protein [Erwinia amylovora]
MSVQTVDKRQQDRGWGILEHGTIGIITLMVLTMVGAWLWSLWSKKSVAIETSNIQTIVANAQMLKSNNGYNFTSGSTMTGTLISQLSDLTIRVNTLDAAFRSGQIGQLTANVTDLETRLKALETQAAGLAPLPEAVQSNAAALASVGDRLSQMRASADGSREEMAQLLQRVNGLENDLKQSARTFDEVSRQLTQKPTESEKAKPAPPLKAAVSAKKIIRSARRVVRLAAPFVLTGIERRGGQTFAVVIPRGMTQISAMRLLSPGDGMQGWTLRAIEGGGTALFEVNGREQRLQVQ